MTNLVTVSTPKAQSNGPLSVMRSAHEPLGWFRTEFDRLFDDFAWPARNVFSVIPSYFAQHPAIDVIKDDTGYHITAELPGMEEKDIDVQLADGVLSITGEKKESKDTQSNGVMLSERHYGAFERHISLPKDVNPKNVKAKFKDGILSIDVGKDADLAKHTHKIAIEKA